jgi:hypothetical protein
LIGYGEVPEEIYIKVRTINKGLEAFAKATGMRQFLNWHSTLPTHP